MAKPYNSLQREPCDKLMHYEQKLGDSSKEEQPLQERNQNQFNGRKPAA